LTDEDELSRASRGAYQRNNMKNQIRNLIVLALILMSATMASANVTLWDTGIKEKDCSKLVNTYKSKQCWGYELTSSLSWKNHQNWSQVTTLNYTFKGNLMIETDNYYMFFHTDMVNGPFYFMKYPSGIIQGKHFGAEQYGTSRLGTSRVGNYHFNSAEIISLNSTNISLLVDSGGWGPSHPLNMNIVQYNFYNTYYSTAPGNNHSYTSTLHSATGKLVVLEDINGTFSLINSKFDTHTQYHYKNISSMIQLSNVLWNLNPVYNVQYKVTAKDALSAQMYITRGYRGIEVLGADKVSYGINNTEMYFGNLPLPNTWILFEPNKALLVGTNYTVKWFPSYSGKYRSIAVVKGIGKQFISKEINITDPGSFNGNFSITSPIKGRLESFVVYYVGAI